MELLAIPILLGSFIVWLAFCILAGVLASSRNRSGFGYFVLSVLFTPLLGILAAALLPALPPREPRAKEPSATPFVGKSTQRPGWEWKEFVQPTTAGKPWGV